MKQSKNGIGEQKLKYKYRVKKKPSEKSFTVQRRVDNIFSFLYCWHSIAARETLTEAIQVCLLSLKLDKQKSIVFEEFSA